MAWLWLFGRRGRPGRYAAEEPRSVGLLVQLCMRYTCRGGCGETALWRVADTLRCFAEAREASLRGEAYAMKGGCGRASPQEPHMLARVKSGREVHTRFFVSCAVPGDTRGGVLVAPGPAPAHNETAPDRGFSGAAGRWRERKVPRGTRPGGSSGGLGGAADEPRHGCGSLGAGVGGPYSGRALERECRGASGDGCGGMFHVERAGRAAGGLGYADESRYRHGSLAAGPAPAHSGRAPERECRGASGDGCGECSTWNGADRGMWGGTGG